jgi:Subtilase family
MSKQTKHHRILVVLVAALTAATSLPARVLAEKEITAQATADDGAFLPFTPPPAQRAGLCLVDTGVNLNPDTETSVVDREAIDNGTPNDVSPTLHGTVLAMLAAAPINKWGTVGVAPNAIQIVSVRILDPEHTTFPFTAYAGGITRCLELRSQYNIKVINLSLGTSEQPSAQAYESVVSDIERANDYGVAVVAAAGNDDGGPVDYPAAIPGVLSVGAIDTQTGGFCSFSNRGAGLEMIAPGCDLDAADPLTGAPNYNYWQGTSEASDIDSAALAALDAYDPQLTPAEAEQDLGSADAGTLDIEGTFRAAGLAQLVKEGQAAEPKQSPTNPDPGTPLVSPPPTGNPNSTGTQLAGNIPGAVSDSNVPAYEAMPMPARFPRPRARLRWHGHQLHLSLTGRPPEAQSEVHLLTRSKRTHRLTLTRTLTSTAARITAPGSVAEFALRYIDPYDTQRDGPWVTLRAPRPQWAHRD